ncbi:MAG TPA: S-layer homology domain-containing protein [Clostridia bacterium]|jgi:hypothetical protein|nr:S-layer homology domain-containing protein [Clostridia bacterium]
MSKRAVMIIIVLVVSMVAGMAFAKEGYNLIFNDLKGHWAEEVITEFALSHLVDGYSDGSFRPQTYMTRAEFCRILAQVYRETGKINQESLIREQKAEVASKIAEAVKKYYRENNFTYPVEIYNSMVQWQKISLPMLKDRYLSSVENLEEYDYYLRADTQVIASYYRDVSPNDWFFEDVTQLYELGLDLSTDSLFHPNQPITREEAAKILVMSIDAVGEGSFNINYADLGECSNPAVVKRAIELCLMKGYADNTFKPDQPLTRAEAVTVLKNYALLVGSKNA